MNPYKNAIIIYDNKLDKFVDKCDDIQHIQSAGHQLAVTFNSGRTFSYNRANVRWITNPQEIDFKGYYIHLKGTLIFSIKKILQFEDWFKVFYENGKHNSYHSSEIVFKRTMENVPVVKDALSYLKQVAEYLKSEDDGGDFLSNQLEKLRPVEGSALVKFLQRERVKSTQAPDCLIFPFGTNHSQMQAVKNAFTYDLSVIQSPPGTGKTQTILNIVANALIMGKTVAVVSGNNEATRNVSEKLEKNGLSFLTAFLGNRENIEKFFSCPHLISPKAAEWKRLPQINRHELNAVNSRLEQVLLFQIQIPKLKAQIAELKIEKELSDGEYAAHIGHVPAKIKSRKFTSEAILKTAALLEIVAEKEKVGLGTKLKYFFKHKIRLTKELLANLTSTIDFLQNKYYEIKLAELEAELQHKETTVANQGVKKLQEQSVNLGKNALYKIVGDKCGSSYIDSGDISAKSFRAKFTDFTKRYPVIFSTTNALQSCTGEGFLYDYLIIDEASQVNIVTSAIAFACAKNVVLVGDKMQLPHVVKSDDIPYLKSLFARFSLPKEMEYSSHSILEAVTKMYGKTVPSTLLNEHYRCDPQIIGFCNKRFYDDSLIVQTTHKNGGGVKLITTEAHHASNRTNHRQVEIIAKDILPELEGIRAIRGGRFEIGIVAPYRNQVELLKSRFDGSGFLIDTVHKFQGKEKTAIIMSTVSDRIIKHGTREKTDC